MIETPLRHTSAPPPRAGAAATIRDALRACRTAAEVAEVLHGGLRTLGPLHELWLVDEASPMVALARRGVPTSVRAIDRLDAATAAFVARSRVVDRPRWLATDMSGPWDGPPLGPARSVLVWPVVRGARRRGALILVLDEAGAACWSIAHALRELASAPWAALERIGTSRAPARRAALRPASSTPAEAEPALGPPAGDFSNMLSALAHELRNMLATINSAGSLLLHSPALPGEERELAELMLGGSRRASAVIDEVVSFTCADGGVAYTEPLEASVRAAAELLRIAELWPAGATLELEAGSADARPSLDAGRARRVAKNLLVEAVRHARGVKRVCARVSADASAESGGVCLEIEAEGASADPQHAVALAASDRASSHLVPAIGMRLLDRLLRLDGGELQHATVEADRAVLRIRLPSGTSVNG